MASLPVLLRPPPATSRLRILPPTLPLSLSFSLSPPFPRPRPCFSRSSSSSSSSYSPGDGFSSQKGGNPQAQEEEEEEDAEENSEGKMGLDVLRRFIQLNVGSWTGSFTQYDTQGNILHSIPTRLVADSYGTGEQVSLFQTLYIKVAPSKTLIADEDASEDEWTEFKLGETNLLTVDRRQQVGFFPDKNVYTVSHQTAEMLAKVLRAGVLGDDSDDEDADVVRDVKLPSRRPALVCESCIYSEEGNNRLRAFQVLDPRGLVDMIGVFHESKIDKHASDKSYIKGEGNTLNALLGSWSGRSVTRRTGIYGATVTEEDVLVEFKQENSGALVQDIKTSKGKLQLVGTVLGSSIQFEKGLQMTLLPGGMTLASPVSVGQSVGRSQSFYFEFSWIHAPGKRRRLVRTYDSDGIVVSTTVVEEERV